MSELKGVRFDPVYLLSGIGDQNENKSKIADLLIQKPQYGANQSASEYNSKFRYIRITDIDGYGNLRLEDPKSCLKFEEKYNLVEGDILMARSGATAGKCLIYKETHGKAIFAGYLIRFKFDQQKVLSKYIFYYTQLEQYDKWVSSIQRPAGQPNINSEEFQSLQIPLPPLSIQQKLADMMDEAYALKKAKETEAKELLDSIDDYVMDELGIKVEEKEEKKVFAVGVSSLFGRRIDPKAFSSKPVSIIRAINNSKYPAKPMQEIIKESFAGEWGLDIDKKIEGQKECGVIRNTNFVNHDNLSFENVAIRAIDPIKFNKVKIQKGDILIEKSGGSPAQPVGRVALFELDEDYTFSNFLQCFRLENECNSAYYFVFMKYIYNLGLTEYYENQTTGIKNLIMESFVTIPIPLPPLAIQQSIATEVMSRRARAKVLQSEAKEILEQAKAEFEREILE